MNKIRIHILALVLIATFTSTLHAPRIRWSAIFNKLPGPIKEYVKGEVENTIFKKAKKIGFNFLSEQWILLLPACDAIHKLYLRHHFKQYSEPVSEEIETECHTILKSLGRLPENYDVRFFFVPIIGSMHPLSKFNKKTKRTIIYIDKSCLHKYADQPVKFNYLLQEQITTALKRPFIAYELLKAVMPFIVAYIAKKLHPKNPHDTSVHPDDKSLNSYLNQTAISVILIQLINYARIERLF